jgi:hypothetical protein
MSRRKSVSRRVRSFTTRAPRRDRRLFTSAPAPLPPTHRASAMRASRLRTAGISRAPFARLCALAIDRQRTGLDETQKRQALDGLVRTAQPAVTMSPPMMNERALSLSREAVAQTPGDEREPVSPRLICFGARSEGLRTAYSRSRSRRSPFPRLCATASREGGTRVEGAPAANGAADSVRKRPMSAIAATSGTSASSIRQRVAARDWHHGPREPAGEGAIRPPLAATTRIAGSSRSSDTMSRLPSWRCSDRPRTTQITGTTPHG